MKKLFSASKLKDLVMPDKLQDVLETLRTNGLIEDYSIDYMSDEAEITVAKNVEIREVMLGFQNVVETSKRSRYH